VEDLKRNDDGIREKGIRKNLVEKLYQTDTSGQVDNTKVIGEGFLRNSAK